MPTEVLLPVGVLVIPTLGFWGMLSLIAALFLAGVRRLRRPRDDYL